MKRKMAWEWNWPSSCWGWQEFIAFDIELRLALRPDIDHHPGIHMLVIILGIKLIDCGYYNIYHADVK